MKNNLTPDEVHELVEAEVKKQTRYWTPEDFTLQLEAMKNISDRPIWNAIYQARKWALIEARASVVKMDSEEERKNWFDREIEVEEHLIENTNRKTNEQG